MTAAGDLASGPLAVALDRLLEQHQRIAIAVSGGCDSVALMHLVAARLRARTPNVEQAFDAITILTVDHRLRKESTAEAVRVGAMALAAGFSRHVALEWKGPHPKTGIQAAARDARYSLIAAYCRNHAITAVLTAHTRDDQAETVLMRLARGTGIDGLGGMAAVRSLDTAVCHHRPLLGVSRLELRGYLEAIGAPWIDDPSNDNPAFERIRWRKARPHLAELGLTDPALTLTASRAARAKEALDWAASREVLRSRETCTLSPLGYAVLSKAWLLSLPAEIRLRVLGPLIEALGGEGTAPPLAALEAACDGLCNPASPLRRGFTLHGAMVRSSGDRITVMREPIGTRRGHPTPVQILGHPIEPGHTVSWDCRFAIALSTNAPEGAIVGPLGVDGLARLRAAGSDLPPGVPSRVLCTLPALSFPTLGLAVPHLGHWPDGLPPEMVHFGPIRVPFLSPTKV